MLRLRNLRIPDLKDLHNLFQNNLKSGKLLNYHSGKTGTINTEIGMIKNALSVRVEEIEKIRGGQNGMNSMAEKIEEIAEKIRSENLQIDTMLGERSGNDSGRNSENISLSSGSSFVTEKGKEAVLG